MAVQGEAIADVATTFPCVQSFPDDYVFLGSIGFQQQQVADAVPPKLAQAVAQALLAANRWARRAATMMRKNGDPKMADTPSWVS